MRHKPLVIKSAGDVYRLPFYRALFPNARFRIIHLRRNPAASINGLLDAWCSQKYQSFRVGDLSVQGYSDGAETWRREWWKLDLPPGWEHYRNRALIDLCEWQWRQAQTTVLDWLERTDCGSFIIRYEDMIDSPDSRMRVFGELCEWIGIARHVPAPARIVNASLPPVAGRWRKREADIRAAIARPACREVAEALEYTSDPVTWP